MRGLALAANRSEKGSASRAGEADLGRRADLAGSAEDESGMTCKLRLMSVLGGGSDGDWKAHQGQTRQTPTPFPCRAHTHLLEGRDASDAGA